MSHYPSTAELASFRRAIVRPLDVERARDEPNPFPVYPPIHRNGNDGAWSWEREKGIGYGDRRTIPCRERHHGLVSCAVEAGDRYARTRREAARMRSRAAAVMAWDCAYCPLGGIGVPTMLDGFPAHPDCADACHGYPSDALARVRAASNPEPCTDEATCWAGCTDGGSHVR